MSSSTEIAQAMIDSIKVVKDINTVDCEISIETNLFSKGSNDLYLDSVELLQCVSLLERNLNIHIDGDILFQGVFSTIGEFAELVANSYQ